MKSKLKLLLLVFVVAQVVSFALYGNSIRGGFVYDDHDAFESRQELRKASHLPAIWREPYFPSYWQGGGAYRPLSTTTFSLNYIIFGESPVSFHLVNVFLNGLVIFMVFIVALELFGHLPFAAITALLFGFLPIHTEVVANIKSRDELLAATFILLSWLLFLKATKYKTTRYLVLAGSAGCYLVALFAKETVVLLPAAFVLVQVIKRGFRWREMLKYSTAFAPSIIIYGILRMHALGRLFTKDVNSFAVNPLLHAGFLVRFWTAFKVTFLYVFKSLVPINLSANYGYNQFTLVSNPLSSLTALLGIAIVALFIWLLIKRKYRASAIGVGLIFFIMAYLIVSKFVIAWGDLFAERAVYVPSIGICLVAGYWLARFYRAKRAVAIIGLCLLLGVYGFIAIQRNTVWASDETLFNNMVKTAPNSVHAHFALATYYYQHGELEAAEREASTGYKISEGHSDLVQLLGMIAYKQRQFDLAVKYFSQCVQQIPQSFQCNYLYAVSLYKNGQYNDSINHIADRVRRKPTQDLVTLLLVNYYKLGRLDIVRQIYSGDLKDLDNLYEPEDVLGGVGTLGQTY